MLRIVLIAGLTIGVVFGGESVPKGATEIQPGVYKHTDSAGKTSIFRKTPFGVVKSSEPAQSVKSVESAETATSTRSREGATPFGNVKANGKKQEVKVVERGDVLEFERLSPFGSYRWKRNKNELTPEEREIWTRNQAGQTPAPAAQSSSTGPKE